MVTSGWLQEYNSALILIVVCGFYFCFVWILHSLNEISLLRKKFATVKSMRRDWWLVSLLLELVNEALDKCYLIRVRGDVGSVNIDTF